CTTMNPRNEQVSIQSRSAQITTFSRRNPSFLYERKRIMQTVLIICGDHRSEGQTDQRAEPIKNGLGNSLQERFGECLPHFALRDTSGLEHAGGADIVSLL